MKPRSYDIIIAGRSYSRFDAYLTRQGINYLLLRHKTGAKAEYLGFSEALADLSDEDSVKRALGELNLKAEGVINIYEPFTMASAWIAKLLSIPGMPIEAAEACFDKNLMRQAFETADIRLNPHFAELNNWQDAESFVEDYGYPVMIKPKGLAKSLLISRSDDLSQLKQNYISTMDKAEAIYKRYAPTKEPGFIIEEYMEGTHHTVQGFADSDGNALAIERTVDQIRAADMGFDDSFIYGRVLPSKMSDSDQNAVVEAVKAGMKAIGMKNALAHCDVVLTADGPRLIEIGARIGGYRAFMYEAAFGIQLYQNMLALAMGSGELDLKPKKEGGSAVIELFPDKRGIFRGIGGAAEVEKLNSLDTFKLKTQPGDNMGPAREGFKACAYIMLKNDDVTQLQNDVEFISKNVNVI